MTDALPAGPTDFISSHNKEAFKAHYIYDVNDRVEYAYTAHPDTKDQQKCLGTQYQYVALTDRVSGSKEFLGTWLSAWDF